MIAIERKKSVENILKNSYKEERREFLNSIAARNSRSKSSASNDSIRTLEASESNNTIAFDSDEEEMTE